MRDDASGVGIRHELDECAGHVPARGLRFTEQSPALLAGDLEDVSERRARLALELRGDRLGEWREERRSHKCTRHDQRTHDIGQP